MAVVAQGNCCEPGSVSWLKGVTGEIFWFSATDIDSFSFQLCHGVTVILASKIQLLTDMPSFTVTLLRDPWSPHFLGKSEQERRDFSDCT